jgi:hypothetical protein
VTRWQQEEHRNALTISSDEERRPENHLGGTMNKALEPVPVPEGDMLVICFQKPGRVFVGRIQKIHKQANTLEVDLLWADQHDPLEDTIWRTYVYRQKDAPRHEGIFKWPWEEEFLTFSPHRVIHLTLDMKKEFV